jgi:hypothetical protein
MANACADEEIEVTPAMMAAAERVYDQFWRDGGPDERDGLQMIVRAYREMLRVRERQP